MASLGVAKYSLAIQLILSSLDNLENPDTALFILYGFLRCKDIKMQYRNYGIMALGFTFN